MPGPPRLPVLSLILALYKTTAALPSPWPCVSGSVAIGAGNATISNAAPINGKLDQRGINRTTSDIGAYSFGIQVTNTSDSNTVGSGSLRAAINLANTTPGNDQISFNLTGLNTITLGSALPTIVSASTAVTGGTAGTVTITGLGASSLIISGSDPTNANNATRNFSIFSIASGGNLSISGVTVSGAQYLWLWVALLITLALSRSIIPTSRAILLISAVAFPLDLVVAVSGTVAPSRSPIPLSRAILQLPAGAAASCNYWHHSSSPIPPSRAILQ